MTDRNFPETEPDVLAHHTNKVLAKQATQLFLGGDLKITWLHDQGKKKGKT